MSFSCVSLSLPIISETGRRADARRDAVSLGILTDALVQIFTSIEQFIRLSEYLHGVERDGAAAKIG
jgi:hypothetical protein